jgi:hypothetical protein
MYKVYYSINPLNTHEAYHGIDYFYNEADNLHDDWLQLHIDQIEEIFDLNAEIPIIKDEIVKCYALIESYNKEIEVNGNILEENRELWNFYHSRHRFILYETRFDVISKNIARYQYAIVKLKDLINRLKEILKCG